MAENANARAAGAAPGAPVPSRGKMRHRKGSAGGMPRHPGVAAGCPDIGRVARAAGRDALAVLRRLLPSGRREGREWVALNPTRVDRRPGSFRINVQTGRWADFATGDKGSDLVSLVAYLERCPQAEAAGLLSRMLGMEDAS